MCCCLDSVVTTRFTTIAIPNMRDWEWTEVHHYDADIYSVLSNKLSGLLMPPHSPPLRRVSPVQRTSGSDFEDMAKVWMRRTSSPLDEHG